MIRYSLGGGDQSPEYNETLTSGVDGAFTMWRSIGSASFPPSPIGRFAGRLDTELNDQVQRKSTAAVSAGNLEFPLVPEAIYEYTEVDGVHASMGTYTEPGGAWGELLELLRPLLGTLTSYPLAALGIDVSPAGDSARLVHLGSQSLRLDLRNLAVTAMLQEGDFITGNWTAPAIEFSGEITVGPGWSLDLPFTHGLALTAGATVIATATFIAYDGDMPVGVKVISA